MRRYYYEDAKWPWRPDEVLVRFIGKGRGGATEGSSAEVVNAKRKWKMENGKAAGRALDLGMGYGRNALWLAERGYEVEGWEKDAQYVREARRESRLRSAWRNFGGRVRRPLLRVKFRQGDFTRLRSLGCGGQARARFLRSGSGQVRGPYEVIVISCVLHMMRQSTAVRVLRRAKAALAKGGRLFLLVKLTHDRRFRQFQRDPAWQPVRGERNTLRHRSGRAVGYRGHRGSRLIISPVQSRFEPRELRRALRGLRVVHFREVVLRSEWEHPRPVTHTVAEVVAEKSKGDIRK